MPNSTAFATRVNELLSQLDEKPSVDKGIELANEIVTLIGNAHTKSVEDVFESSIELPNAERYDSWFQPHPIFKSDRACFDLADAPLLQAKFYWLKKRSRQILAGGVHFTPNYEDEEFTHNERYKVGLDFFLSPNGKSLQVVLSNRGNLRIVELSGRLNNTQKEIFEKWIGAGSLKSQEALHTTLWESFKLKSVNQKFYDGVSNSFTELLQHLKSIDKDEEEAKLFASRLLGRLLFCWFLRKKGIIDESVGYFNAHGADATAYYKQSLERLFFLTLNTPIDERDELTKQHQKTLFPELVVDDQPSLFKADQKTPYLNGGLFEPHENDWHKDDSLTLPEGFFTNLYDHFEEFNFTTDESSPEYEQIAIDPEMLGRVFESLLATQVDETGQQARKAKGAFYTPREIVSYMCKESLRSYLYNAVNNDESIKESIDSLLDITDSEWAKSKSNTLRDKVKDNRTQIIDTLDAATILDPACGSGAFPMGMLQLMLKTYERLESRFDPYKTKLSVIQNNIFGVDIEPMAVEISRLRAWLSLIVDEDDPRSVDPLPNLDFKFVCANSLVPLDKEMGLFSDSSLHQKLTDIRTKYFNARKKHTKKALQDEYHKLTSSEQTSLITEDNRTKQLKSFDPFKNSQPARFFDSDHMFGLSDGFSILIGNPPYISVFQLSKDKSFDKGLYKELYRSARGSYDIFVLFFELGITNLENNGVLAFITPNKYLSAEYAQSLRSYLEDSCKLLHLIDVSQVSVFDAAVYPIISIFQTCEQQVPVMLGSGRRLSDGQIGFDVNLKQPGDVYSEGKIMWSNLTNNETSWISKLDRYKQLSELSEVSASFTVSDSYKIIDFVSEYSDKHSDSKKLVISSNIDKYRIKWGEKYISYLKNRFLKPVVRSVEQLPITESRKLKLQKPKIIIAGMTKKLRAAYDSDGSYVPSIPTTIITNSKVNEKYLTAVLNSKLIDYYYRNKYDSLSLAGGYLRVGVPQLSTIPIAVPDNDIMDTICEMVDKCSQGRDYDMTLLNIDKLIYEIYEVSADEILTIEEATK